MTHADRLESLNGRRPRVVLGAVLTAAFLLRVWNLSAGVPFAMGIDEPFVMYPAMRMLQTGDFNPHFFDYPGLYIYTQLAVGIIVFMAGATSGAWSSLKYFGAGDVYVWGRLVTAGLGTATVWLVYQVGRTWGTRCALTAAALMAVAPLHVRESHYVLTDVPMTFFLTLALLLSMRAAADGTLRAFVWAGAAVGLAAGTKYNGAYAMVLPFVAWAAMAAPRPAMRRTVLPALLGSAMAFLVVAPYTLLDLPAFLNAWGKLAAVYQPRGRFAEPGWLLYLKHLRMSLGWPGFLLCAAGLALVARRLVKGPDRVLPALVLAFPVVYFLLIARSALVFGRYALPLLPFVSLWGAAAIVAVIDWARDAGLSSRLRAAVAAALVAAALLPAGWTAVSFLRMIGTETTQALAWKWIDRQVMTGTPVLSEAKGLALPGERYSVQYVETLATSHLQPDAAPAGILILSSDAWGPDGAAAAKAGLLPPSHRHLLALAGSSQTFKPGPDNPGPTIHVLVMRR